MRATEAFSGLTSSATMSVGSPPWRFSRMKPSAHSAVPAISCRSGRCLTSIRRGAAVLLHASINAERASSKQKAPACPSAVNSSRAATFGNSQRESELRMASSPRASAALFPPVLRASDMFSTASRSVSELALPRFSHLCTSTAAFVNRKKVDEPRMPSFLGAHTHSQFGTVFTLGHEISESTYHRYLDVRRDGRALSEASLAPTGGSQNAHGL